MIVIVNIKLVLKLQFFKQFIKVIDNQQEKKERRNSTYHENKYEKIIINRHIKIERDRVSENKTIKLTAKISNNSLNLKRV